VVIHDPNVMSLAIYPSEDHPPLIVEAKGRPRTIVRKIHTLSKNGAPVNRQTEGDTRP
jgi:hypothetical protein